MSKIIFIDSSLDDYQSLIPNENGTDFVVLNENASGIDQITQALAGRTEIDAIHILSHGSSGSLKLGSDTLNNQDLAQFSQKIQDWKKSLTPNADILLYGCDVAQGENGLQFVQNLHQLTGADIAASDDQTGKGGDWNLEVTLGEIGSPLVIAHHLQLTYQGVLGAGDLDTSFNSTGKVTTDILSSDDGGNAMTIDSSGKILVAGLANNGSNYDFALARYNSDGSLDTTFGTGGKVTTGILSSDDLGYAITIDSNGKILVAGYAYNGSSNYDFALARYNSDGSLDTTFDTDGKVTTAIGSGTDLDNAITIDSNGKILVAGYAFNGSSNFDFALARYNPNGSLDTSFDTDGKVTTDILMAKSPQISSVAPTLAMP